MKCKKCGYCCTLRVSVNLLDVIRIMLAGNLGFTEKGADGKRYIKMDDNKCYFLENKNFCRVYRFRPKACRQFPFGKKCSEIKKSFLI